MHLNKKNIQHIFLRKKIKDDDNVKRTISSFTIVNLRSITMFPFAINNDIESEMAMDESMADGHVETFLTPVLETSAVAPLCQRETGEMEGGGGKTKAHHEDEEDRGRKDFPTPILETSAVAPLCQRETGETEGGGGKTKAHQEEEENRGREDFPTPVLETSAVAPVCQRETGETEGGGGKIKVQHDEEVKIEADVYDEDRYHYSLLDCCHCSFQLS